MKISLKLFALACTLPALQLRAQPGSSLFAGTSMALVSEDRSGQAISYAIPEAYMLLKLSTGDFTLNADLSTLQTGDARLDSLLLAGGPMVAVFNGNIDENILLYLQQQNDEKDYNMPGQMLFNGNTITCVAQFDPVNLADKSESKNYRMDLTLPVDAKKLLIPGLETTFAKQVVFEIKGGRLNIQN